MSAGPPDLMPEEADVLARVGGLGVDLPAMAVVANVWRAAQASRAHLERRVLREQELTWTGFAVLFDLWIWGDSAPRETRDVAASVGVAKSTLTGVLDTLEGRGLVQRTDDPADRRLRRVRLTSSGSRCMRALFPRFNAGEGELVADLSEAEQDMLAKLLRRIIRTARKDVE